MSSLFNLATVTAAGGHRNRAGYRIDRSVRFRASASAYFNRTPASAGNRKTWTWSGWVKRGDLTGDQRLFEAYAGATSWSVIVFDATAQALRFDHRVAGTIGYNAITNAIFRDPSAWCHVVVAVDTTLSTATDRVKFYVNGVLQTKATDTTTGGLNQDTYVNFTNVHHIGRFGSGSQYLDGYLTEVNFIDGQALTPSSFGETNTITGVWQPKRYTGTYGTNGFYLNFSDNSAATAAAIGKDSSGNGNNWTPNNISVTAGVTYDSMLDSPTQFGDGGNGRGNYATLNPLLASTNNAVLSNGNLTGALTFSSQVNAYANMPIPTTGKWYWETTVVSSSFGVNVGIRSTINTSLISAAGTGGYSYYNANGNKYDETTATAYGTAWFGASRTDVIGVAYDADTRQLSFYLNGVSQGVAFTVSVGEYYPSASHVSGSGSHTEHFNFGQRPFSYTPPSGFKALNTFNLP
jgi:hypothetical protein